MSETTYSLERDLKEASAMAKALEEYVQHDELYGRVGGGLFSSTRMPSLTIGALLMRLRRLRAMEDQLSAEQRHQLRKAEREHERVKKEWAMHYHKKLLYEAHSRLKAMDHYFAESADDPRSAASGYLPEALRRTIVQEIANSLDAPDEDLDKAMRKADSGLRRWVEPASFIWAPTLEPVYPKETYWWLYSRPIKVNAH